MMILLLWLSVFAQAFDCDSLGASYQQKLTVPYRDFTDLELRKCASLHQVNASNLPGFIALTFYDNSLQNRKSALEKLEAYQCPDEPACEKFHALLDAHTKATALVQANYIKSRAERLREKLAPKASAVMVERCRPQAIAGAQAIAKLNGPIEELTEAQSSDGKNFQVKLKQHTFQVRTSGPEDCKILGVEAME